MRNGVAAIAIILSPSISYLGGYGPAQATSIALVMDKDGISVATDSRVSSGNGESRNSVACKIRNVGPWHFTANGLGSTAEFNVFDVVAEAVGGLGDFADNVESVSKSLIPKLTDAINLHEDVRTYAARPNGTILGVLIFGYEKRGLKLGGLTFKLDNSGAVKSEIRMCPQDCPMGTLYVAPAVDASKFDGNVDRIEGVRRFVQMEIGQNSSDIGPPLQRLHVDPTGVVKWFDKPAICNDQE